MEYYAGIDVSLKESSVCVVDAKGKVVREVKVASEPETVVRYFDELELPLCRIGLEAGPLSQWLHAGLVAVGRDVAISSVFVEKPELAIFAHYSPKQRVVPPLRPRASAEPDLPVAALAFLGRESTDDAISIRPMTPSEACIAPFIGSLSRLGRACANVPLELST